MLPHAVAGSPDATTLAATLALLVGGLFLIARLLKLGSIADYMSRSVLVGYLHGVVVVLIASQLGKMFGVDIEALDPGPGVARNRQLTMIRTPVASPRPIPIPPRAVLILGADKANRPSATASSTSAARMPPYQIKSTP